MNVVVFVVDDLRRRRVRFLFWFNFVCFVVEVVCVIEMVLCGWVFFVDEEKIWVFVLFGVSFVVIRIFGFVEVFCVGVRCVCLIFDFVLSVLCVVVIVVGDGGVRIGVCGVVNDVFGFVRVRRVESVVEDVRVFASGFGVCWGELELCFVIVLGGELLIDVR